MYSSRHIKNKSTQYHPIWTKVKEQFYLRILLQWHWIFARCYHFLLVAQNSLLLGNNFSVFIQMYLISRFQELRQQNWLKCGFILKYLQHLARNRVVLKIQFLIYHYSSVLMIFIETIKIHELQNLAMELKMLPFVSLYFLIPCFCFCLCWTNYPGFCSDCIHWRKSLVIKPEICWTVLCISYFPFNTR